MRRFTIGIVMTAVLALGTFGIAGAQGPRGGAGLGPRGEGGGPGRAGMLMLRGLDLTDQQRSEVRAILQAQQGALDTVRAEARLHRELRAELLADAPDSQKLADIQQQLAQAHADRLGAQVAVGQQLAQVLTPEQRATARERLAGAPERGARGRGPEGRRARPQAN
jgi:Spy/CpxP family protein refolding chaperone